MHNKQQKYTARWIAGCEGGPCPNGYVLDGDCMIQGQQVTDPATLEGIAVAPGETFVRVPRELIIEMGQRLAAEGS